MFGSKNKETSGSATVQDATPQASPSNGIEMKEVALEDNHDDVAYDSGHESSGEDSAFGEHDETKKKEKKEKKGLAAGPDIQFIAKHGKASDIDKFWVIKKMLGVHWSRKMKYSSGAMGVMVSFLVISPPSLVSGWV